MQLYLLEFTYAVEDREMVEAWLLDADLSGVLISNQQYDDEVFAVLASEGAMREDHQKLSFYPAISSCQTKQSVLYRIITTGTPEAVFHSFPLAEGDEWYWGAGKTCYLSTLSLKLKQAQITWLATCSEIASWEYIFDLVKMPASH